MMSLFSLLTAELFLMVWMASSLDWYRVLNLVISSLTVGTFESQCKRTLVTYHGASHHEVGRVDWFLEIRVTGGTTRLNSIVPYGLKDVFIKQQFVT